MSGGGEPRRRSMLDSAGGRLATFVAVLLGVFAVAYAVGERFPGHSHLDTAAASSTGAAADDGHLGHSGDGESEGDGDGDGESEGDGDGDGDGDGAGHAMDHGGNGDGAGVAGLSSLVDGHRVRLLEQPTATTGALRLTVERDGAPVTRFDERHGAQLHLIVVSADLSSYQHLHPMLGADGVWTVPFTWETGGTHRLVVDIAPSGYEAMALGTDVASPLPTAPVALPAPADLVTTVEGLQVLRSDGRFLVAPAVGLEPYLGQPAHLVAFRAGNLVYRHLHAGDTGARGAFDFAWDLPPGTWRLFLQFSRYGEVITVPFTVEVAS